MTIPLQVQNKPTKLSSQIMPWLICFLASLFFAYELLQLHVMNSLSVPIIKDLALSAPQFATLCSTYLWADVLFLLPAGMLLDRFSVRKVILTALALCLLGTFGLSQSQSYFTAAFCHFFSGIGNAFCFLSCIILISNWFPKEKHPLLIGLMITTGMLGGVVAQHPFSLLAAKFNWRGALQIDALSGFVLFILIFLFVDTPPKKVDVHSKKEPRIPFLKALQNPHTLCCGIYTCFLNLPLMILGAVWGSLFLTQAHQIDHSIASFIVSLICIGTIVGSPIVGFIDGKLGNRYKLMSNACILSFLCIITILALPKGSYISFSILFFFLGFFTSAQSLGYPEITEKSPSNSTGTSMGIAALIIMGLPALIQPISGALLELNWNGLTENASRIYSINNFRTAFAIFPMGFIISFLALRKLKRCR